MDRRTRTGLNILEAALLLGVLGDALLRATPWGLNVLLWVGVLLAGFRALAARCREGGFAGEGRWLLGASVLAAAAFAWRDSPTLKLLDAAAICVALSLLAWRARGIVCQRTSLRASGSAENTESMAAPPTARA
jgi:hypothetical protein